MSLITHINYKNLDGLIYCCLRNRVVELNRQQEEQFCQGCKMFGGMTQDQEGVRCNWEDMRNVSDPHIVYDPVHEFNKNQKRSIIVSTDHLATLTSYCLG